MDFYEKLRDGYYDKPGIDYPRKPKKPYLSRDPSSEEALEYTNKLKDYEKEYNKWKDILEKYFSARRQLFDEFSSDLEEFHGVKDNPKRTQLFNIAWDLGHSGGYNEVANYYNDFVELIK